MVENENNYKAAYGREKKARLRAEELLENKTRELYNINEQLQLHTQALARSNQELTQFAFIASHDLKEPLRKIKTYSNFLLDDYGNSIPDEGRDYIVRMHKAVDRMDALIEGLLYYSRITRSADPFIAVDLNVLIQEITHDLGMRIAETGGTINVRGNLQIITADAIQMRQLLQNLISNALKFHQKDKAPVVTIATKLVNKVDNTRFCEITVTDNGIGFDEKYANKIFSIFQRLHGQSEYEGYGIGLAVCKQIVERHKGEIKVKSIPNSGSVFSITIPASQEEN